MKSLRLAGKVAIITGASKGTGAVMGKLYADAGTTMLMVARNEEAVREATAEAENGAIGLYVDVSRYSLRAMKAGRSPTNRLTATPGRS